VDDEPSNQDRQAAPAGEASASPEATAAGEQQVTPQNPAIPSSPGWPAQAEQAAAPPPGWQQTADGRWVPAPGWWQAPDGRWVPPPQQPPPGWWLAPDGRWVPPPGWSQAPDGRWVPPPQQPPPGWWLAPDGRWQPPAGQGAAGPSAAGAVAGSERANDGRTFGLARGPHPGDVSWNWRDVLLAVVIAAAPIAVLTVLGTLSGSGSGASAKPTAGFALAAIVSTVLVDGWLVFWAWFFSLRKYRLPLASFGFRGFEERSSWGVAGAVIVGGVLATIILGDISDFVYRHVVGPVPQENVVTIFPHTSAGLVLFVVLAVLIAPVLEETFFRGFVFQGLASSWGPIAGALLSALVFAAWHQQLSVLIPIFGLGVLLAAAFYWTRSIYANMTMHAVFNALGIVAWWFIKTKS
jgi:membrane protease YdiL (CAAX protease family)